MGCSVLKGSDQLAFIQACWHLPC